MHLLYWSALSWKLKKSTVHSQCSLRTSLLAQMVKNLPAMQEMRFQSLGQEDPLKKGLATHSRILAWRIPMDRGAWPATVHKATQNWTWLKQLSTQHTCTHGEKWKGTENVYQKLLNFRHNKFISKNIPNCAFYFCIKMSIKACL